MDPTELPDLKDIHLPGPPDIWLLALGWWLLIAIILILSVSVI